MKHSFDLLAEEEQPELLIKYSAISLLDAIHRAHGIRHEFVDPNARERNVIGYKGFEQLCLLEPINNIFGVEGDYEAMKVAHAHDIAHQYSIRERFWLNELQRQAANTVLFVCGDLHLRTFPKLLAAEGIVSEVIKGGIGVDYSIIEYKAFEFAEANNMFDETDCFCLQS
jgi:hypothetical protein